MCHTMAWILLRCADLSQTFLQKIFQNLAFWMLARVGCLHKLRRTSRIEKKARLCLWLSAVLQTWLCRVQQRSRNLLELPTTRKMISQNLHQIWICNKHGVSRLIHLNFIAIRKKSKNKILHSFICVCSMFSQDFKTVLWAGSYYIKQDPSTNFCFAKYPQDVTARKDESNKFP